MRELERLAFEQHIVKAPGFRGQRGGVAHLALVRHQRQTHRAAGGVARGPRFARARLRRMTVGAQRLAVDPRIRHGVDDFVIRAAEHMGDHGGGGDFHQHHMIETDTVKTVLQRDHTLNLVRFNHAGEHIAHGQRLLACRNGVARQPVGGGEDAAKAVRRMAPLGGEPGVVKVEPANHAADVECGADRIKLKRSAGHFRAIGHDGAGNNRPHQLGAGGVRQRLKPAAQRVHQTQARGVVGLGAFDRIFRRVGGDVGEDFIGFGAGVRDCGGHLNSLSQKRFLSQMNTDLHR